MLFRSREEGRERGRSVLGSRTIGFGVRRSRSGTTNLGSQSETTNRCCDCDRDRREGDVKRRSRRVKSNSEVEGCDLKSNSSALWVRSLSGCDLSSRSLAGRRGVLSPSLFFLYLTLTQLSLSLSIFRKIVFEGKIKTEINLHPTHGQLKTISENAFSMRNQTPVNTEKHFRK